MVDWSHVVVPRFAARARDGVQVPANATTVAVLVVKSFACRRDRSAPISARLRGTPFPVPHTMAAQWSWQGRPIPAVVGLLGGFIPWACTVSCIPQFLARRNQECERPIFWMASNQRAQENVYVRTCLCSQGCEICKFCVSLSCQEENATASIPPLGG